MILDRKELLDRIETHGEVGMSPEKTCAIVGISENEFFTDVEIQKRFRLGQYKGEFTLRETLLQGVREGNPQMCKMFLSMVEKFNIIEIQESENIEDEYEFELEVEKHGKTTANKTKTTRVDKPDDKAKRKKGNSRKNK